LIGARGIPTTVFISGSGKIIRRFVGTIKYTDLVSNIEEALK
jgi:hypothetical protein